MLNVSDPVASSYPPIPHKRETRNREVFRIPGLGPQVSGAGYQVQVRVRENSDPEPVTEPEDLNLAPDGWDPRPEKFSSPSPSSGSSPKNTFALLHRSSAPICTFALSFVCAPSQSSGLRPPLSAASFCSTKPLSLRASRVCSPCPPVTVPACPLALAHVSPCPRAHVSPTSEHSSAELTRNASTSSAPSPSSLSHRPDTPADAGD